MSTALHAGDVLPDAYQPDRAVAAARASGLPAAVVADHIADELTDLDIYAVSVPVADYACLIAAAAAADDPDDEEEVGRTNRVPSGRPKPQPGDWEGWACGCRTTAELPQVST